MALQIALKPYERVIIGGAVVRNGKSRTELLIENSVPILREKEIMSEQEADTPCRRIYFTVQLMYVDEKNLVAHHRTYWKLVKELVEAAPSTTFLIEQISQHILSGRHYQALKLTKKLIAYETEVIRHATTDPAV